MEFKELLQAVFQKRSYFADFFGGGLEALDGVQENETAFYVKTSDIPVVVGDAYDKGENVAFGTGTGSTPRFCNRTEVIIQLIFISLNVIVNENGLFSPLCINYTIFNSNGGS